MTPKPPPSVVPAPPNYAVPEFAFPNAIPGRQPPHSDFVLWPEVTPQGFPVTPPIPPTVQTGDVITAAHENTVSTAINDLWIDLQSLGSTTITDPTQAQGDLIVRTTTALSRLIVGANGTLLTADNTKPEGMKWATVASTGAVPSTRQVLAGTGMTGGGPLSADVTLNAKVTSVNGQIGAVVLAAADISGAVPNTRTITPADATLIVTPSGGALSSNLTFQVAPDTSIQKIRYSKDGVLVGTRREVNLIPGSNVTITVTDDIPNNRINVNLAAAGGGSGGMTDPTVNPGDLIVRGTSTTTNLAVGTVGQVLTADAASGLKMKWAAQQVGVAPTRRIDTTAPALTGGGDLTADLVLTVNPDTIVQKHITSYNGTQVGTRRETNFIPGSNVSLLVADDTANNRVNVTINSTAVGGAQSPWTSDINAAGFTLYSAGKVGIGIASPQAPLHVVSSSVATGMIETTAASGGFTLLNLKTVTSFWQVGAAGAGTSLPGSFYIHDQQAAGTRLVIGPSGTVGIGVGANVASSLFQVGQGSPLAAGIADFYGPNRTLAAGTAMVNILSNDAAAPDKGGTLGLGGVSNSPSGYAFAVLAGRSENNVFAGYFQLSTVNSTGLVSEWLRVTSTGQVGIGTSNPGYQLDVIGKSRTSQQTVLPAEAGYEWWTGNYTDATSWQVTHRKAADGSYTNPLTVLAANGNLGLKTTNPIESLCLPTGGSLALDVFSNGGGIFFRSGFSPNGPNNAAADLQNYSLRGRHGVNFPAFFSALELNAHDGLYFTTSETDRIVILPSGDIGINKTSPDTNGSLGGSLPRVTQFKSQVIVGTSAPGEDGLIQMGGFGFLSGNNWNGISMIGVNLAVKSFNGGNTIYTPVTHGSLGYSAIQFNGNETIFVAQSGLATTGGGAVNPTERMRLTATGRLGIGIASPSFPLDVIGDVNTNGNYKWNALAIASMATRNDVTGSRAVNTTYGNPYGRPMLVNVTAMVDAQQYMQLLTDSGNPPTILASVMTNTGSIAGTYTVSAIVMPGHFIKAFLSSGSLNRWIEWA